MWPLKQIMLYFISQYPHKAELSKARLTKMVYLADWKFAIDHGAQISTINWKFNHFGPYVEDVHRTAIFDPDFAVLSETNAYGKLKERISLAGEAQITAPPDQVKAALDHVINETKPLHWDGFIKLVYSTYPILSGTRGENLDLVKSALEYRSLNQTVGVQG